VLEVKGRRARQLFRAREPHVDERLVGQNVDWASRGSFHSSISGKRMPGSGHGKISCTPASKRRKPTVCPLSMFTTHTPHVRSRSRCTNGMPLKTALSRTCERPMKANGPTKSIPRVKPGTCATVRHERRWRSISVKLPSPDSSTHNLS
jgi:hypothetical protein